jgi:hypothetical protein
MKLSGDQNECRTCGERFDSVTAFDAHRVGPITDRRCLTTAEMQECGLCRKHGFWWADESEEC